MSAAAHATIVNVSFRGADLPLALTAVIVTV